MFLGISLVPVLTGTLCMYTSFLARFCLAPVNVFVNFVALHKEYGLPHQRNPSSAWYSCKTPPPHHQRQFTGYSILPWYTGRMPSFGKSFDLLSVIFGLLRKAHFPPGSDSRCNPVKKFTRSDFSRTESGYSVLLRWSKTIQMEQHYTCFFNKKNFHKKMSYKNQKNLRKC